MKVYVDELPKDCVNCDFGYANNFCEIDYELDLRKFDKNQKHPKCPLQSLADHDKQVRKEIVKEVLDFIEEHKAYYFEQRDYYGAEYIFFNRSNLEKDILDQIATTE